MKIIIKATGIARLNRIPNYHIYIMTEFCWTCHVRANPIYKLAASDRSLNQCISYCFS